MSEAEGFIESGDEIDATAPPVDTSDEAGAPAPDDAPDSQATAEEDAEKKAIAKYAFEARTAERKAKELEKRLQELEARASQSAAPVVPPPPDPFTLTDEAYREQQARRETAIRERAEYDARQVADTERRQALEIEQQRQQAKQQYEAVQSYSQRAVTLGVTPEELSEAGGKVADFGIKDGLAQLILQDDQGPLITKYLASNPMELDELSRMSEAQAAVRIATIVKHKAAALKPRVPSAPDPNTPPRGAGVAAKDYGEWGTIE